jgi:hypothetical protein
VGFIYHFNTCVHKKITFACQSKKSKTSTPAYKGEVNFTYIVKDEVGFGLNHLPWDIVEDEVGFGLTNAIVQAIIFLHANEN